MTTRLPDNLYCVGGDVKPCSINQPYDEVALKLLKIPLTEIDRINFNVPQKTDKRSAYYTTRNQRILRKLNTIAGKSGPVVQFRGRKYDKCNT